MSELVFSVWGNPAPKGSRTPGRRKNGSTFTRPASKAEHPWVENVAARAFAVSYRLPNGPDPILSPPYFVRLSFWCPKPAKPTYPYPSLHDLDKLVRAVFDGMVRGGVLVDDRHVTRVEASKAWAERASETGVFVAVRSDRPPEAVVFDRSEATADELAKVAELQLPSVWEA